VGKLGKLFPPFVKGDTGGFLKIYCRIEGKFKQFHFNNFRLIFLSRREQREKQF
jgi:hypothetical protein